MDPVTRGIDELSFESNSSNNNSYQYPFNSTSTAVSASIIFFFMVIGVTGNSITMMVILKYKELKSSVFMRFILSLCVSDLISALISWLFLYRRTWGFDRWDPIPGVFCTFYWAADLMTSYVTALHILSFATLRLISIRFPLVFNKVNMKRGNVWVASIWVICFLCGFLPACFIFGPGNPRRNSDDRNARWPACTVLVNRIKEYTTFQFITYPIFLCVPVLAVSIICGVVVYLVKQRSKTNIQLNKKTKSNRKEKQAVFQLILIIVAFLIGYVPFLAYEFWAVQDLPDEDYYRRADYWFGMVEYFFLRFSECLNPIFYNLGSRKLRNYTIKFLKEQIPFCKGLQTRGMVSGSESGVSTNVTNFGV